MFTRLHPIIILSSTAILAIPLGLFWTKAVAPLYVLCVVLVFSLTLYQSRLLPRLPKSLSVVLAVFYAWCLSSLLWTVHEGNTIRLLTSLPLTFITGLILASAYRDCTQQQLKTVFWLVLGAVFLGLGIVLIEANFAMPFSVFFLEFIFGIKSSATPNLIYKNLHTLNNGITIISLFVWPASFLLYKNGFKIISALLPLVSLIVLAQGENDAAVVALVLGIIISGLAILSLRATRVFVLATVVLGVLTAPWIARNLPNTKDLVSTFNQVPSSVPPRIAIWKFTVERILEAPLVGHGLRTARTLAEGHDYVKYYIFNPATNDLAPQADKGIPLHPHNGILQVWVELGAIGAVLGLGVLLVILSSIRRLGSMAQVFALAQFVATLTIATVSYGLWQGWWQSTIWLTASLMVAIARTPLDTAPSKG